VLVGVLVGVLTIDDVGVLVGVMMLVAVLVGVLIDVEVGVGPTVPFQSFFNKSSFCESVPCHVPQPPVLDTGS
jgi:hypothetical protein